MKVDSTSKIKMKVHYGFIARLCIFLGLTLAFPLCAHAQTSKQRYGQKAEQDAPNFQTTDNFFNVSEDKNNAKLVINDVISRISAHRKRGDGILITGIPAAEENTRRVLESGIDTFVVGDTAFPTDQFRDVVLLVKSDKPVRRGDISDSTTLRPQRGICSAVVVSDQTLLTAAHCICRLNLDREADKEVTAAVWTSRVIGQTVSGRQRAALAETAWFTLYVANFCTIFRNTGKVSVPDIALLHLDDETIKIQAEDNDHRPRLRRPVFFASSFHYFSPIVTHMTVVGYGISNLPQFDRPNEPMAFIPKVGAVIPVIDMSCRMAASVSNFNCRPGQEIVLVDKIFGNDTCQGDSGGPAYIRYYQRYYLAGITSRGISANGLCGDGGVYTLLTPKLVAWIHENARAFDPTF